MSYKNIISLILPTRNRPDNILRMWESALHTASGEIEACFYIDEDDTLSEEAIRSIGQKFVRGPRKNLTTAWNDAARLATGDIWMQAGDDLLFRTPGWDTIVRTAFDKYPDKMVFVYGNDEYQGTDFGTHGFTHALWPEVVGYWHPEYLDTCSDVWFNDVAREINRSVYVPITTEHMHYVNGKSYMDATYTEKRVRDDLFREVYNRAENQQLLTDAVTALRGYINTYELRSND